MTCIQFLFDKTKKNFNIPSLFNILRDFKKFTSKTLIAAIKEIPESRRDWMLNLFWYAGKNNLYSSARDYAREKGLIDIEFA